MPPCLTEPQAQTLPGGDDPPDPLGDDGKNLTKRSLAAAIDLGRYPTHLFVEATPPRSKGARMG
jgi:hypothetical protein